MDDDRQPMRFLAPGSPIQGEGLMRYLSFAIVAFILAGPTLAQYRDDRRPPPRCIEVCEYRQFCAPIQGCYPIKKCRQRCRQEK